MNKFAPDRAVVEVPDSNMILVIGHDEFGCVELSMGMKQQKISQDLSVPNTELTNKHLEILRENHAFRVDKDISKSTVEFLTQCGFISAVTIDDFNDPIFVLAGEALKRRPMVIDVVADRESIELEPLSM